MYSIVVWGSLFLVGLGIAPFAPAWVVALLIPLGGMCVVLLARAESREHAIRLHELEALIEEVESDEAGPDEAGTDIDDEAGDDPFDRLRSKVIQRNQWIADAIDREVESGAMLRAYLNAIDTPVIATRETGRIAMMNRPARKLFGRGTPGEARTAIEDLIASPDVLTLHRRAGAGEACQKRVRLSLGMHPRVYEVSAIPVRVEISDVPARVAPRRGVVLTFRDVHDLAQTLQLRTDFAANASHELRTPIASIKAAIETMRGPAADDPAMQTKLGEMIENNVIRLEETVNDLLDLSRLEAEDQPMVSERFDAIELCETLSQSFDTVCERRRVKIALDLDPSLRRITSDRKALLLILRNLLDNATKFAFEGTTVRLIGEALPPTGPTPDSESAALRGVRFRVIDRGVGIPLKHQQRIFERFFQVDESRARIGGRRGSGLGLSIVRHALRGINGEIEVESVWQEGTTMTVTIPRCLESDIDCSPDTNR